MEQLKKNISFNVLNSKKIFLIQDIECISMSCQLNDPSTRFLIGQEVTLISQKGDVINFSYGGEFFSAPSYYFVTKTHWKDITATIIKERTRKKIIKKNKRTI